MQHICKVHVIFKTHLDVGFTDFAACVIQMYFDTFIPKAIQTAHQMRQQGINMPFVWTTGSWLIYEYLEQASPQNRRLLEQAIETGDITWHGLPFTTHSEFMDAALFRYGLSLSQRLDQRFGKKTIAAKMTDVPGHTRAIVPLLAEAGIKLLHIGVNPASTAPNVPPIFIWQDQPSNTSVIVIYSKSGYGDATLVPDIGTALTFAHTNDNLGPHSMSEVIGAYSQLQLQFPQAAIRASTLDAFAQELLPITAELPVITGELGDTWIHGVGTDPTKVSQFRELLRLRSEWQGETTDEDTTLEYFNRSLLMVAEHTWGLDSKLYLDDYEHYSNTQFHQVCTQPNFQKMEASWLEQRQYINNALESLGSTAKAQQARSRLGNLHVTPHVLEHYKPVIDLNTIFETPHFSLGFDPRSGAISHLVARRDNYVWAAQQHPIGLFRYELFSSRDYDRFYDQYVLNQPLGETWPRSDFTKPGLDNIPYEHQIWSVRLDRLYTYSDANAQYFVLQLAPASNSTIEAGMPQGLSLTLTCPFSESTLHFDLQWLYKSACRLPEALWFSFIPLLMAPQDCILQKMGCEISSQEVIQGGNQTLHAVMPGIIYRNQQHKVQIESLDTSLVAPGSPSLLNFTGHQPDLGGGIHFNLYNNIWATNFPLWFDESARFRFSLHFDN